MSESNLRVLAKKKEPSDSAVETLEELLRLAKEGEIEAVLGVVYYRGEKWKEFNSNIVNFNEKIGVLTRMMHALIRGADAHDSGD